MKRALLSLGVLTISTGASAGEIPTVFFVSKSQNKNQVHYALHGQDETCAPLAVRPYWRLLERGPDATEPISEGEQRYFAADGTRAEGNELRFVVPSRPITIRTWRGADGACAATAYTPIQHVLARLYNVHAVIRWFRLDHLLFTGWTDDGAVIRESVGM